MIKELSQSLWDEGLSPVWGEFFCQKWDQAKFTLWDDNGGVVHPHKYLLCMGQHCTDTKTTLYSEKDIRQEINLGSRKFDKMNQHRALNWYLQIKKRTFPSWIKPWRKSKININVRAKDTTIKICDDRRLLVTSSFAFYIIIFEPIAVQICSAPQNDRLNLSFVKYSYQGSYQKMARNGQKKAIREGGYNIAAIVAYFYYSIFV